MAETLACLEAKRQGLIQALAALGDFRRGTISVNSELLTCAIMVATPGAHRRAAALSPGSKSRWP